MNGLKRYILLILYILNSITLCAQWKVFYYDYLSFTTLYQIANDANYLHKEEFYFPSTSALELPLKKGIYLKEDKIVKEFTETDKQNKVNIKYLVKEFDIPLKCTDSVSFFYPRLYLKNISSYIIYIYTSDGELFYKIQNVEYDGYQIPEILQLTLFQKYNKKAQKGDTELNIKKIYISLRLQNEGDKFSFVIGDLLVGEYKFPFKECQNNFFSILNKNQAKIYNNRNTNTKLPRGLPILYYYQPFYNHDNIGNTVILKNEIQDYNEFSLLTDLTYSVIDNYKFYKEKKLSEKNIREQFTEFISKSTKNSLFEFAESLNHFLRGTFNDGHLYLKIPEIYKKQKLTQCPISLYEINNKICIAGIFNEKYKNISIGDEILSIDKISIKKIIDSLMVFEYGTYERRRAAAISTLLLRGKNDSVNLTVRTNNDTLNETVWYNGNNKISSNFIPKQYEMRIYKDSVVYFRINYWDRGAFIRFINYWEIMRRAKGIILDLRGNSGGNGDEAIRLFSLFIHSPKIYNNIVYPDNSKESLLVIPDSVFHLSNNVVILADSRSACTSEEFIGAMKSIDNCSLLGTTKTAGTLMSAYKLVLPSGIEYHINCIDEKTEITNKGIIEDIGIEPDIWIKIRNIQDLYPYNDILLKTAINYILFYSKN